jgi:hypothetical protein
MHSPSHKDFGKTITSQYPHDQNFESLRSSVGNTRLPHLDKSSLLHQDEGIGLEPNQTYDEADVLGRTINCPPLLRDQTSHNLSMESDLMFYQPTNVPECTRTYQITIQAGMAPALTRLGQDVKLPLLVQAPSPANLSKESVPGRT